jgi:hypothetical protein
MKLYGLKGRVGHAIFCSNYHLIVSQVIAINCDNTSNNDTMAEALEILHQATGLEFDAQEAHLHCMPHTVLLVALEAH